MPSIEVNDYFQALTADGDTSGYAKVADSSGYYVGCIAYIQGATAPSKRCLITEIEDGLHIGLRFIADDMEQQLAIQVYGGRSDLTGYTVADGAKVYMERQVARVEPQFLKPNLSPK
jgi:hypothetical protein